MCVLVNTRSLTLSSICEQSLSYCLLHTIQSTNQNIKCQVSARCLNIICCENYRILTGSSPATAQWEDEFKDRRNCMKTRVFPYRQPITFTPLKRVCMWFMTHRIITVMMYGLLLSCHCLLVWLITIQSPTEPLLHLCGDVNAAPVLLFAYEVRVRVF